MNGGIGALAECPHSYIGSVHRCEEDNRNEVRYEDSMVMEAAAMPTTHASPTPQNRKIKGTASVLGIQGDSSRLLCRGSQQNSNQPATQETRSPFTKTAMKFCDTHKTNDEELRALLSAVISQNNEGASHFDEGCYDKAMECFQRSYADYDTFLCQKIASTRMYERYCGITSSAQSVSKGSANRLQIDSRVTSGSFVASDFVASTENESWDSQRCMNKKNRNNSGKESFEGIDAQDSTRETTSNISSADRRLGVPSMLLSESVDDVELAKLLQTSPAKRSIDQNGTMTPALSLSHCQQRQHYEHRRQIQQHRRRKRQQQLERGGETEQDKSQNMYQRNEYDEGMQTFPCARRIVPAFNELVGAASFAGMQSNEDDKAYQATVLCTILCNIGKVFKRRDDKDRAIDAYRRALRASDSVAHHFGSSAIRLGIAGMTQAGEVDCHIPLAVEALHGIGQVLYYRGDHADSLQAYKSALDRSMEEVGGDHPIVAASLNCIGVLHYHMTGGETNRALDCFKRSLEIRRALMGPDLSDVATTLNNIGRIHFQRAEYDESMEAYGEALRIRRSLFGDDNLDVAATVFNTGQAHHQKGQYDEALSMYEEFAAVAKVKLGAVHRDVAIVTTCVAQIHHERRDYDRAMELYREALRVGRAALGEMHPEVAITLNKIGNLHYERGDLEEAISSYYDGLRVERSVLESANPNIVVTLTNIAEIHKQREEYSKAMDRYKEALSLQRKNLGNSHPDVASTLNSIGMIFFQQEEYYDALDFYQESLRLRREHLGDDHVDVAATLTNVGLVLLKKGMQDMAIQVFLEALRIRRTAHGPIHRDVAFTMYNVAVIHHQRGDYEHAMRFYSETMALERAALGPDHPDVAITLYNIGQVHYQCGNLEEALGSFEEALRLERRSLGNDHPSVARTLNDIGNIHLQKGNVKAVMKAFTEALRIYRKAGLSPENLVVVGRNLYAFETVYPEAAGAA